MTFGSISLPVKLRRAFSQITGKHGRMLLAYTLLAFFLAWPLPLHFTTHVPGDGIDDPALLWNLWWIKTRLVDHIRPDMTGLDIFHVDWMFHPISINLAFYTLTPLNGLLSVPLQAATALIPASNLLLLSSFVLSAYGAALLSMQLLAAMAPFPGPTRSLRLAATVAGLIYAFASAKWFYASLGQFNIASSQWIPFTLLYFWRAGQSPTLRSAARNGLMAGLFLAFQTWAELTYASFLLIWVALFFLWRAINTPASSNRRAHLQRLMVAALASALVFLLTLTPFLAAMLPDLRAEGDFFTSGGGFADIFSADLQGYLVPTRLHPILGQWVSSLPFPNDKGQHIFLGYTTLLLATAGFISCIRHRSSPSRPIALFWLGSALLFWLLTLGPTLRWAGQDLAIPGPFDLVSRLPFFSGNRYPSRYSVMLLISVTVLAAAGLHWLLGRVQGTRRAITAFALSILLLAEHLSFPLPLSDLRVPPIYNRLASLPHDFTLLELPTGWRNGARVLGKSDLLIMLQQRYQTVHGKRRLGGNTSRNPERKFQYFTTAPLLGDLIALMNADPEHQHIAAVIDADLSAMIERNLAIAPSVLDFLGVEYLMLHVDKSPPALLRFVEEALPLRLVEEWQGVDWSGAGATLRLYAVEPAPEPADSSSGWAIDLAAPQSTLYLAEGWNDISDPATALRYSVRPRATLLLDLPDTGGTLQITLSSQPSRVAFSLNGSTLQQVELASAFPTTSTIALSIPPGAADQPVDRLELQFSAPGMPAAAISGAISNEPTRIGSTGATLPASTSLVVQSAGEEVGDFAHIYLNGRDLALNQRGYNLVALSPAPTDRPNSELVLLASATFDTFAAPANSAAMAAWLRSWPPGTIIAGAVADEASYNLGQDAIDALASIGVTGDLRGKFRWSHAFIGATGAPPGSAVETLSLIQPATVYSGHAPLTAPLVYGAVSQVTFASTP